MLPKIANPISWLEPTTSASSSDSYPGITAFWDTSSSGVHTEEVPQGPHHIRHHKSHLPATDMQISWWQSNRQFTGVTDHEASRWTNTDTQTGPGPGPGEKSDTKFAKWLPTNITFPFSSLESRQKQSTMWDHTDATGSYGEQLTSDADSDFYPNHIPSVAEYASQHIPSQAGIASHLTGGGHNYQVPTASLYNIIDIVNNSNSSYLYNISMESLDNNNSAGGPTFVKPEIVVTPLEIILAVILSGFIIAIIVGNMFVILSVALFRDMRTLTNGLIVSLASADILVAIIVLPISLFHEIMGSWTLGPYICDFWITSDVFCCTASILNIVVIAVDRYWLITKNVRYTHNSTFPRQRVVMILCFTAWLLSGIISSSPLFGWQAGSEDMDPYMCIISQDLGYTIFSTFGAFWFPLGVILLVYMKIFKIARKRAKTRAKAQAVHPSMNSTVLSEANGKPARYSRPSKSDSNSPQTSPKMLPRRRVSTSHSRRSHRGRIRSSARTLGLIIGGFVFCWLPFFIMATILPFCSTCQVPPYVMSIVLWLGYSNSLLNPAIYAIWDKNFRRSFKRLATCSVRWSHVL